MTGQGTVATQQESVESGDHHTASRPRTQAHPQPAALGVVGGVVTWSALRATAAFGAPTATCLAAVGATLCVAAVVDVRTHRLPNLLLAAAAVCAVAGAVVNEWTTSSPGQSADRPLTSATLDALHHVAAGVAVAFGGALLAGVPMLLARVGRSESFTAQSSVVDVHAASANSMRPRRVHSSAAHSSSADESTARPSTAYPSTADVSTVGVSTVGVSKVDVSTVDAHVVRSTMKGRGHGATASVGMGDVKAAAVIGASTVWLAWWAPFVAIAVASALAAAVGLAARRRQLALGPFLVAGWVVAVASAVSMVPAVTS